MTYDPGGHVSSNGQQLLESSQSSWLFGPNPMRSDWDNFSPLIWNFCSKTITFSKHDMSHDQDGSCDINGQQLPSSVCLFSWRVSNHYAFRKHLMRSWFFEILFSSHIKFLFQQVLISVICLTFHRSFNIVILKYLLLMYNVTCITKVLGHCY